LHRALFNGTNSYAYRNYQQSNREADVRVFAKDFLGNFVVIADQRLGWEPVGYDMGVRTFDDTRDAAIIAELDKLADERRKGVRRISAEVAAELKKNMPRARSKSVLDQPLRAYNPEKLLPKASSVSPSPSAAPVGNVPPAPVFTQSSEPTPPVVTAPVLEKPVEPPPPAKPRTMKKSELKKLESKV
jgi:hypothetical protein